MTAAHQKLYFLNAFSQGLPAPVLTLIFLAHGAETDTLGLILGVYSLTVVLLELPSGMFADRFGRKQAFFLSHLFLFLSFCTELFCKSLLLLIPSVILLGMGRAFGSGSIEAYEVEAFTAKNGTLRLSEINRKLMLTESCAMISGALSGGLLASFDQSFRMLLLILIFLELLLLFFSAFVPWENSAEKPEQRTDAAPSVFSTLFCSGTLLLIAALTVSAGLCLSAAELFWQPALLTLLPERFLFLLGPASLLGYAGVGAGGLMASAFLNGTFRTQKSSRKLYLRFRLLFPLSLLPLSFARSVPVFLFFYFLSYAVLGAGNLAEQTVLHASVENRQRASLLSLLSLLSKGGGLGTGILCSFVLSALPVQRIFIPVAVSGLLSVFVSYLLICSTAFKISSRSEK